MTYRFEVHERLFKIGTGYIWVPLPDPSADITEAYTAKTAATAYYRQVSGDSKYGAACLFHELKYRLLNAKFRTDPAVEQCPVVIEVTKKFAEKKPDQITYFDFS